MENIEWLTNWFEQNCDGDWEHNYSIHISTLDNPGWSFKVDISDTDSEGKLFELKSYNSEGDWYTVNCDGFVFEGFGDNKKLMLLIGLFRELIENNDAPRTS